MLHRISTSDKINAKAWKARKKIQIKRWNYLYECSLQNECQTRITRYWFYGPFSKILNYSITEDSLNVRHFRLQLIMEETAGYHFKIRPNKFWDIILTDVQGVIGSSVLVMH